MTHSTLKILPIFAKTPQGFTLLELLVALAIFAMMATMAYGGLNTIINAHLQTERLAERLANLQMTFVQLKRDLEQAIDRSIRDEYGDTQPAFQGTSSQLEFTRAGWRNPLQQPRSSLQRVAYYRENNALWKMYWSILDRAQDTTAHRVILLNEVEDLKLRFLVDQLQWHERWPPTDFLKHPQESLAHLPQLRAVEVTLTVREWGRLTWLFQTIEF